MTVSVILCSHNRAEHLEKTLQSLRDVKVPTDWTAELLLADNASTDRTPALISSFEMSQMQVRGLREPTPGKSYALNRAISEASGDVLLFTDDDVRFPPDWIEGMVRPILSGTADAVAGGVELADEIQRQWMTPLTRAMLASTGRIDSDDPDRMVGANMAIARHVFSKISGFDPELGPGRIGLGEDTLLSWQLREAGFRIEAAFDVVVRHCPDQDRLSREAWEDKAKRGGKSGAYLNYHWEHRQHSFLALCAGWMYYVCRLYWKKALNEKGDKEECPMEEFVLRRKIYRIRQYLRMHGKPRKYDRRGLLKRDA
jgi:glycosyltransferase involved in cell wall biosynthesis